MPIARLQEAARRGAPESTRGERERMLRRAEAEGRVPRGWCVVVGFVVGFAVVQGLGWLMGQTGLAAAMGLPETFVAYVATQAAGVVGGIGGLVWRDVLVRRALARPFGEPRCPGCRQSLAGLPVVEDAATCPECGTRHELGPLGLIASDLRPLAHAA